MHLMFSKLKFSIFLNIVYKISIKVPLKSAIFYREKMLQTKILYGVVFKHKTGLQYTAIRMLHNQQQKQNKYSEHFKTLGLPETATKSNVRYRYIELVKKHHPDTSNDDGEMFNRIDHAFKQLLEKFREDQIR